MCIIMIATSVAQGARPEYILLTAAKGVGLASTPSPAAGQHIHSPHYLVSKRKCLLCEKRVSVIEAGYDGR